MVLVPLLYTFLSRKKTELYEEVLEVVKDAVKWFHIAPPYVLTKIMSDFVLTIMNACTEVIHGVSLSGYYFHLGHTIYRRVQGEGLQEQYRDPLDRTVKWYTHMVLALAFFKADVVTSFAEFVWLNCMVNTMNSRNFLLFKPARSRRPTTRLRYPISLWNQYKTAINNSHRTNNMSEYCTIASNSLLVNTIQIFAQRSEKHRKRKAIQRSVLTN